MYSERSADGNQRKPPATVFNQLKEFLDSNFLAWFFYNWRIKKRCRYPAAVGDSIHPLKSPDGGPVVRIGIAADWATATPQSVFVGERIRALRADYTIHLGDTYYSGSASEHADNFGQKPDDDTDAWARGRAGSFALVGNHEMFSSGQAFMDMINSPRRGFGLTLPDGKFAGQQAPFCCLRSEHWCILCLDTGYDSLHEQWYRRLFDLHPNNRKLKLPDLLMNWLEKVVDLRNEERGIIVLTHHQYISAFTEEDEFQEPARQLQSLLPAGREVIWINGHEHRFAMYRKYQQSPDHITAWVRCIGHGGMADEHTKKRMVDPKKADRGLEVYDYRVADTFHFDFAPPVDIGYNGYIDTQIEGDKLTITFWAAYWNGSPQNIRYNKEMLTETWQINKTSGALTRLSVIDHTIGSDGETELTYCNPRSR